MAEIVVAVHELVPDAAAGVLGAQRADVGEGARQGQQAGRIGGRGGGDRARERLVKYTRGTTEYVLGTTLLDR